MKINVEKILSAKPSYNLNDYTVVVFGAGNTSVLYQKCFEREGIKPVYYIDNSEAKQGTLFQGVPVISVEKLVSLQKTFDKPVLVIICSTQITTCNQIQLQLQKNGLICTTIDAFVFEKNKKKIKSVYDSLADDFSRNVYIQMIQSRFKNIPVPESIVNNEQYFLLPKFIDRSEKEIFVDLGAYVGDTIEQYINKKSGVFRKIYAFEPDILNFTALVSRAERLKKEWAFSDDKLELVHGGVGGKTEQKLFTTPPEKADIASSRLGANFITDNAEDSEKIMIYAIDDYFTEKQVSFIKADIESYELDMLHGAEAVIKRDRPLLAVCIYHNASDMYTIPLFLKELCGDYKLMIRQHSYRFDETALYAYI